MSWVVRSVQSSKEERRDHHVHFVVYLAIPAQVRMVKVHLGLSVLTLLRRRARVDVLLGRPLRRRRGDSGLLRAEDGSPAFYLKSWHGQVRSVQRSKEDRRAHHVRIVVSLVIYTQYCVVKAPLDLLVLDNFRLRARVDVLLRGLLWPRRDEHGLPRLHFRGVTCMKP